MAGYLRKKPLTVVGYGRKLQPIKARITYALSETNLGKIAKLSALQSAYRDYVQSCIGVMVAAKRHHVKPAELQKRDKILRG